MAQYDYMAQEWIDDKRQSVRASEVHPPNAETTPTREGSPKPKLSLVEWFIVGPIVVGLGFMVGIMWP
jgi:hypothetical protein